MVFIIPRKLGERGLFFQSRTNYRNLIGDLGSPIVEQNIVFNFIIKLYITPTVKILIARLY